MHIIVCYKYMQVNEARLLEHPVYESVGLYQHSSFRPTLTAQCWHTSVEIYCWSKLMHVWHVFRHLAFIGLAEKLELKASFGWLGFQESLKMGLHGLFYLSKPKTLFTTLHLSGTWGQQPYFYSSVSIWWVMWSVSHWPLSSDL